MSLSRKNVIKQACIECRSRFVENHKVATLFFFRGFCRFELTEVRLLLHWREIWSEKTTTIFFRFSISKRNKSLDKLWKVGTIKTTIIMLNKLIFVLVLRLPRSACMTSRKISVTHAKYFDWILYQRWLSIEMVLKSFVSHLHRADLISSDFLWEEK